VRSFQTAQVFVDLSIKKNLLIAAQSKHQDFNPFKDLEDHYEQDAERIYKELRFDSSIEATASELSHGEKKKLDLGMALLSEPELLLLDEPTSGMSSGESRWIVDYIKTKTDEFTILLIEHDMDVVFDISDRITVLNCGSIIAGGKPEDISGNEEVQRAYLEGQ